MSDDVTHIENNTARPIFLPKTDTFEKGIWLVPGLNRVPNVYLNELREFEVDKLDRRGKKVGTRRPGEEALKAYTEQEVAIHEGINNGAVKYGPQLTIYAPGQVADDTPTGPKAPESLQAYSEAAALALIERVVVPERTLELWKKDSRKAVAAAAAARLATMKGGKK